MTKINAASAYAKRLSGAMRAGSGALCVRSSDSAVQNIAAKMTKASPRWAVRRKCETRGSSTSPLCTMYQPIAPCSAPSAKMPKSFGANPGGILRRAMNHSKGSRNTAPIARPSSRWKYSHQKMPLNASRVMP